MSHTCLHRIFHLLIQLPKALFISLHEASQVSKASQILNRKFSPVQNLPLLSAEFWTLFLLVSRYDSNQQYINENELPIYHNKQLHIYNINTEVDHQSVYQNGFSILENEQLYIHNEAYHLSLYII